MAESSEVLRLRILLSFYRESNVTVTGLARELGEEKYTISRLLSGMEEEGLVDRTDNRHPKLTPKGEAAAARSAERFDAVSNCLQFRGVSKENAVADARAITIHLSEESIQSFRNEEALNAVKHEFCDRRKFAGSEFFTKLPDGEYELPFIIYREKANNITNISMVNEGFEHPGILSVKDGSATIRLSMADLKARSAKTGETLVGRVSSLLYFDSGDYLSAELNGNTISFPADSFYFSNLKPGVSPVLHGALPIRVSASVGTLHMLDSLTIFTVIL